MNKKDMLKTLGRCYNKVDFSDIEPFLRDDAVYEAYDCLYRVTSSEDVMKVLSESCREETGVYEGFFKHGETFIKRITECILICDSSSLKCIRIVQIKKRRRKIANILGLDPKVYEHTRGKKIGELERG